MGKITNHFFLSYQGVCLKNNFLLFDSVHRYPLIVFKQYKRALIDLVIAKYSKTGKYKILDNKEVYLIVNHPWFNYYHWMAESIPRIVRFINKLNELTLIIPQEIYNFSFVRESLLPFQFKNIEINDEGWHYHIPRGIISPIQKYCYIYDEELVKKTRELYKTFFLENCSYVPFRKIYVTRRNAARRKFLNEEEIIKLMTKYEFEIVELESVSLKEQIVLFSETKYLVSMHGAALTNMLFMKESTKVIELYRKKSHPFELKSKVYINLARALSINHTEIACNPINRKEDFFNGDLIANIKELENEIRNE